MRSVLILLSAFFALAPFASLSAQSLEAFKARLAAPVASDAAFGTARVVVSEQDDAARAVNDALRSSRRAAFKEQRVCIFSSNKPDARSGAEAAQSLFRETYPGVRVYPSYKAPYFNVTVGNCLTSEEAIMLLHRVSATFPKAYLTEVDLSVSDLLE